MFRNYFVTAWRNLVKNGMFSAINIFGLALGLMSCILIMLFVRAETGFDQWLPEHDRVVRMHTGYEIPGRPPFLTVRSAGSMMPAVMEFASAEVEAGVRFVRFGTSILRDNDVFSETVNMVDGGFFNVFDLPFAHGSAETAFTKPFDLIISEETAMRYFGRTDVVGEVLTMCCQRNQQISLPVTGVLKDLPDQTHLDIDMLVYMQPAIFNEPGTLETWNSVNVYTYFKMREGVTLAQFQERIRYWVNNESPFLAMVKENFGALPPGAKVTDAVQHKLMPVADLHLHARKDAGNMGDFTAMGDQNMIVTFTLVAGLILLIACINFMNLSTARASQRAREVAMRKVLGASQGQVAIQFLGEAILLVAISMLFALVLVEAVLPLYNDALGRELEMKLLNDVPLMGMLAATALIVGIGAGSYPALVMSRFLPGAMLRGSKGTESGGASRLRTVLVVMQFAVSITLVICTVVIYGQTKFAQNMDTGFVSEDKLVLNIRGANENREALKQELRKLPGITSVVFSSEAPTQDNENNTNFRLLEEQGDGTGNSDELLNYHNMDYGFFEAYDIKPVAGRLFDEAYGSDMIRALEEGSQEMGRASVILNESAVRKLGVSNPQDIIGKTLRSDIYRAGNFNLTVVGVIPDIYFRSIKFAVRPTAYMLNPDRFNVASLTFSTQNVGNLMSEVERVWKKYAPLAPINLQFLSEMMDAQYQEEMIQAELFFVFSLLAIFVACLGLYGLAAFTTERRTREIGIRKVMGASVQDIIKLLIWQFSKPVFVANVIAWPIAVYTMLAWLQTFPYRLDVIWLLPICVCVGGGLLLIAWLTVGGNAARVARTNPAFALRQE